MKKLFLLLLVVGGAFALSSCQKGYTCTETYSVNGALVNTTIYSFDALTAKEKTDQENTNTYSFVNGGGDQIQYVTTCK